LGTVVKDYLELPSGTEPGSTYKDQTMAGRERTEMLEAYIFAVENGDLIAPRIGYMYNEHKFARREDLFGTGHLPDTISASALAWHMRTKKPMIPAVPAYKGEGLSRTTSPWKM
jgi:hypothetical protein